MLLYTIPLLTLSLAIKLQYCRADNQAENIEIVCIFSKVIWNVWQVCLHTMASSMESLTFIEYATERDREIVHKTKEWWQLVRHTFKYLNYILYHSKCMGHAACLSHSNWLLLLLCAELLGRNNFFFDKPVLSTE